MPAEDYFVPTDLAALRMESELLTLENTYLKGRIAALEQELQKANELGARVRRKPEADPRATRADPR